MLRPLTPTRCLLFLALVSCVLLFTLAPRYDLLNNEERVAREMTVRRADSIFGNNPLDPSNSGSSAGASATSAASATSSPDASTSSTSATSAPASQSSSSTADSATSADSTSVPTSSAGDSTSSSLPTSTPSQTSSADQTSSDASTPSQGTPTDKSPTPTPSPKISVYSSLSTNAQGETVTVLSTVTSPISSSASASATSGADNNNDDSSSGTSTSTIIGLSVAGGIAFLGIVGFVIWKFTRKRFGDDFDDNEAIKWPELNAHGDNNLALPTNRGAGFETTSEVNLTRPDSRAGSIAPSAATSAVDLYAPNAAQDPYAVPPLPHLNPNQPYRDDPTGSFYDPYNGPVPQTFAEPPGAEAIPMTQINRMRSPAPPSMDPGRAASPGPAAAYYPEGGRNSPGPRAMSPGPGMALSGRMSPGPGPALAGRASPGPGQAYGYAG